MAVAGSLTYDTKLDTTKFKEGLGKIGGIAKTAFSAISTGTIAVAGAIATATATAVSFGTEYQKASNQIQASTGATQEEMNRLNSVMKSVYADNFGESLEDVANAISLINQQMGYFETDEELKKATESAITLRDTFGYDLNESIRAGSTLMGNFGISAEEAFNLITQGAQNGLDFSGELLDNINEYSVQFKKVGLSAEDMFNIFKSGSASGAFNLDKIGDAVKEFSIRAIDGSNTTIEGFKKLGLNADTMAEKFAKGGDTAKEAFYDVIDRIANMNDKVDQSIVGVDLFGTMWEDLGPEVVTQLGAIRDGFDASKNSAEQLMEIKYNDFGSAMQGIGRMLQTNLLLPMSEKALPIFNDFANNLKKAFSGEGIDAEAFSNAISNLLQNLLNKFIEYAPQILSSGATILQNLILGIQENLPLLAQSVTQIVQTIVTFILQNLPLIINTGIQLILQLIIGIAQALPQLIPQAVNAVITLVNGLIDNLPLLVDAGIQLLLGVVTGIINALPQLIDAIPEIITKLVQTLTRPDMLARIIEGAIRLMVALAAGLIQAIPQIIMAIPTIIGAIKDAFVGYDWGALGRSLLEGLLNGFSNAGNIIWSAIKKVGSSMIDGIKSFFGIHSPSRVMAYWGKYLPQGFAVGIEADTDTATKAIDDMNNEIEKKMRNAVYTEVGKMNTNATVKANNSLFNVTQIEAKFDGSVDIDGKKAGRIMAPSIMKTVKQGGAY